jgi:hypothetical protein
MFRDISSGIATVYGLRLGFDSRQYQDILLVSIASRPALESTQPPIKWVPRTVFQGVMAAGA